MSAAKLALVAGVVAISLSACGTTAKPEAGTIKAAAVNHKGVNDPRTTHVECLRAEHIPVTEFSHTWLQIGTKPSGPTVHFEPTPGCRPGGSDRRIGGERRGDRRGAAVPEPGHRQPAAEGGGLRGEGGYGVVRLAVTLVVTLLTLGGVLTTSGPRADHAPHATAAGSSRAHSDQASLAPVPSSATKLLGQRIMVGMSGTAAPSWLLRAAKAGQVGSVILFAAKHRLA